MIDRFDNFLVPGVTSCPHGLFLAYKSQSTYLNAMMLQVWTLPETKSKAPEKWIVGILYSFLLGKRWKGLICRAFSLVSGRVVNKKYHQDPVRRRVENQCSHRRFGAILD